MVENPSLRGLGLTAGIFLALSSLAQALTFAYPFRDHAVIQRDKPVAIWGTADPSQSVTISIADKVVSITADAEGKWKVTLPALPAGGPHEIVAKGGAERVQLSDILAGDVWLCSGQSNMQWAVAKSANAEQEIATADYPSIRFFPTAPGTGWKVCSPSTVGNCSGVAYYFAREQWRKHGVPIGLIVVPVGGSRIQLWISREGYLSDPELSQMARDQDLLRTDPEKSAQVFVKAYEEWRHKYFRADLEDTAALPGWAHGEYDDRDWFPMRQPGLIEGQGFRKDGVFWLRTRVALPSVWAGKDLVLRMGKIDDADITYVNGGKVGATTIENSGHPWAVERGYPVPADLVKGGSAVIAIRISDYMSSGGSSPKTVMNLQPAINPNSPNHEKHCSAKEAPPKASL